MKSMSKTFLFVIFTISLLTTRTFSSNSVVNQQPIQNKTIKTVILNAARKLSSSITNGFKLIANATREEISRWEMKLSALSEKIRNFQLIGNKTDAELKRIELLLEHINLMTIKIENLRFENELEEETKRFKEYAYKLKLQKLLNSLYGFLIETLNFGVNAGKLTLKIIGDILTLRIAPYLISGAIGGYITNKTTRKIRQIVDSFTQWSDNTSKLEKISKIISLPANLIKYLINLFEKNPEKANKILKTAAQANPEKFETFMNNFGFLPKAVLATLIVAGVIVTIKKLSGKESNNHEDRQLAIEYIS